MKIESLFVYPIKSCRGIAINQMAVHEKGPDWDRQWMVVDSEGRFLSQRTHPQMAQIETQLTTDSLIVRIGSSYREIGLMGEGTMVRQVQLHNVHLQAHIESQQINDFLSHFLGQRVFLVRHGYQSHREVQKAGQGLGVATRFADGFPFLLTQQKSLDDLNSRMQQPVLMDRFRPNVVVTATSAFEEDNWIFLKTSSGMVLENIKPCGRCIMITVDQEKGVFADKEVLKTLSHYRKKQNAVNFGINLVHRTVGTLQVGEELTAIGGAPVLQSLS